MELLELKDAVLEIFDTDIDHLGDALMDAVENNKIELYDKFCELVDGDLAEDHLQKIFQYYHADRKEKKQYYTPKSIALFMSMLIGKSDVVTDMCAGSGALTIQRWNDNKNQKFYLFELDEKVIPFLLFNLAVRNIDSTICRADVLTDTKYEQWRMSKGEKYGRITYFKPAVQS